MRRMALKYAVFMGNSGVLACMGDACLSEFYTTVRDSCWQYQKDDGIITIGEGCFDIVIRREVCIRNDGRDRYRYSGRIACSTGMVRLNSWH